MFSRRIRSDEWAEEVTMRTRPGRDVIDQGRRQLLTMSAAAITAALAATTVLATSAFARSARAPSADKARRDDGSREPTSSDDHGQRWPGAKYDQNGYYID